MYASEYGRADGSVFLRRNLHSDFITMNGAYRWAGFCLRYKCSRACNEETFKISSTFILIIGQISMSLRVHRDDL